MIRGEVHLGIKAMKEVAFSRVQKDFARVIYTSELLTIEGRLQRQGGYGVSISVIVEKIILPWSGLLSEILRKLEDDNG